LASLELRRLVGGKAKQPAGAGLAFPQGKFLIFPVLGEKDKRYFHETLRISSLL
jgi:hypothetical protein